MRNNKFIFLICCFLLTFIFFGRSLRYSFVYDDHWRVEFNSSLHSLRNPSRFFTDLSTQGTNGLDKDSYRPLVMFSFAVDQALWGNNPFGYRLTNFIFHALNGFLVGCLAMALFEISLPAVFLGSLIFLLHPIQSESVVWLVERTNVMGLFFMLLALYFWRIKKTILSGLTLFASLLSREIAVCFPVLILIINLSEESNSSDIKTSKIEWQKIVLFSIIGLFYFWIRARMMGQVAIAPWKGGTLLSNIANVIATFPLYIQKIFWPISLRATYSDVSILTGVMNFHFLLGVIFLFFFFGLLVLSYQKNKKIFLCLAGFLLFWLPGSNIIPMQPIFAERLLYPLMVFVSWLAMIGAQRFIFSTSVEGFRKKIRLGVVGFIFLLMTVGLWKQVGVWKNELTLWSHAVKVAPQSWFSWGCLGEVYSLMAAHPSNQEYRATHLSNSEFAYKKALSLEPPKESMAVLLFNLALVEKWAGNNLEAVTNVNKAIELDSSLELRWKMVNEQLKGK